ncbi:hypothetical protein RFM99_15800 [Mesorhizobium sp. VK4C]|uniref:hypothetical protein n=1 Tax=Mesorhizobium captivum TaxID=3072319 RepID=UPI002A23BD91|nr:hypothetical protein [Mesorhizobium sp. VK4C]MDX8499883.1 hypothetical protein [Mesorhizobium sp. VK4C]
MSAIERHVGFPKSRARQVARRLQEAHILPLGGPGIAPELDAYGFISLLIALAADAPLHEAAEAVSTYRALTPGGVDLTGAPESVDTAGRALDIFADIAAHGEPDLLRRDFFEVVSSWPEIAMRRDGAVTRFASVGALASHWQAKGHRKSITINGAALVDAIQELFGDSK